MEKKLSFDEQYCLLPWISLELGLNGNTKPCCKLKESYGEGENKIVNTNDIDFEKAWKSEAAGNLRLDFIKGKKSELCKTCWIEEDSGVESLRQSYNRDSLFEDFKQVEQLGQLSSPLVLDFKLGNICNLKCRICEPFLSSTWQSEYLQDTNMPRKEWNRKYESYMNQPNWEVLRQWIPNLKKICFYGGEPLLQKDFYKILDLCLELDCAKNIHLTLNTNTTLFDLRFVEYFKKFKKLEIMLSVDDVKERFEYQRHPAKWVSCNENMKKFDKQKNKNTIFYNYITVSIFNVFYLEEIFIWSKENFPEHSIFLNLVHFPNYFSISNLPNKLKSEVARRLRSIKCEKYNFTKAAPLDGILEFLNTESDMDIFREGVKEIKRADAFRAESFHKVFPEISEYFI